MTNYNFYYLAYIFFLFLVETAVRNVLGQNFFFVPMLVLLTCLAAALKFEVPRIVWLSFFAGFLLEIFSGRFFGNYIFAMELAALLTVLMTKKIAARDVSAANQAFLVVLGTLFFIFGIFAYDGLFALLGSGAPTAWKSLFSSKLLWTMAVNLFAFYPVKFFFDILSKQDSPR